MKTNLGSITHNDDELKRTNDEIILNLKNRNSVVNRLLDDRDPVHPDWYFRAEWNNGVDPVEAHVLQAGSLREALFEAEGIEVIDEKAADSRFNPQPNPNAKPDREPNAGSLRPI